MNHVGPQRCFPAGARAPVRKGRQDRHGATRPRRRRAVQVFPGSPDPCAARDNEEGERARPTPRSSAPLTAPHSASAPSTAVSQVVPPEGGPRHRGRGRGPLRRVCCIDRARVVAVGPAEEASSGHSCTDKQPHASRGARGTRGSAAGRAVRGGLQPDLPMPSRAAARPVSRRTRLRAHGASVVRRGP